RMFRIDGERSIELRERSIWLVPVVIGDTEIRARVHVFRIDAQGLLVPTRRFVVSFAVEIQVAKLDAEVRVRRISVRLCLQLSGPGLVKRRGLLGARRSSRRRGRSCRRRGHDRGPLAADNPADQYAEKDAGNAEHHGVASHLNQGSTWFY